MTNRVHQRAVMGTGLDRGPSESYDSNRGMLKSTRVACGYKYRLYMVKRATMMATVNATITQQIMLQL